MLLYALSGLFVNMRFTLLCSIHKTNLQREKEGKEKKKNFLFLTAVPLPDLPRLSYPNPTWEIPTQE